MALGWLLILVSISNGDTAMSNVSYHRFATEKECEMVAYESMSRMVEMSDVNSHNYNSAQIPKVRYKCVKVASK